MFKSKTERSDNTLYKVTADVSGGATSNTSSNIVTLYGTYDEINAKLMNFSCVVVLDQTAYVPEEEVNEMLYRARKWRN